MALRSWPASRAVSPTPDDLPVKLSYGLCKELEDTPFTPREVANEPRFGLISRSRPMCAAGDLVS